MALQSSGDISLSDIETEFGGTAPTSLSEYYDAADGVPASGDISFSDFYGTSALISLNVDYITSTNRTDGVNATISASTSSSAPCAIVAFFGSEDESDRFLTSMTIGGVAATSATTGSDNTDGEHASVAGGYRTYASDATGQTIDVTSRDSILRIRDVDKSAVAYYVVSGTHSLTTVDAQAYADYANPTTYSISVQAGDAVFVAGSTRGDHISASGMTLAAEVSIDNDNNWLDLYYKEVTEDGAFSTTIDRTGANEQYSAVVMVLRPTDNT